MPIHSHDAGGSRRCTRRLIRLLLGLTLTAVTATACQEAGPGLASELRMTVVSPNGEEGSALIELIGPVQDVEATGQGWLLTSSAADTTWVLVAAAGPGTLSFRVHLSPDGRLRSSRLLDVAGPGDTQRQDLTGYSLEVR